MLLVLGVQPIAGDAFDSDNIRKTKLTMSLIYSFFRNSRHYSEKHSHRTESPIKTVGRRESSNESAFDSNNIRKTKLTMSLIYSFFRDSRHYSEKYSHRTESPVKTVGRRESSNESI